MKSRFLTALGALMVTFGGAAGIGEAINPKYALIIATAGAALTVFNDKLQGTPQ